MKAVSRLQRAAIAGAFAITSVVGGGSVALAQTPEAEGPEFEPDYYESMLIGYEIEVSGSDFAIDDVVQQNYSDGENEQVYIESDFASAQVSFFDDEDAPDETIELWISDLSQGMDALEIVDSGLDDDVTWYFAEGEYEDTAFVYYVQITEDVEGNVDQLESVLTIDGFLVDSVEAAQGEISVDGEEFMDDVDLEDLEELVDGGSFRDGGGSDDAGTSGDDDSNDRDRGRDRDDADDSADDDNDRDRSRDRDDDAEPDATEENSL